MIKRWNEGAYLLGGRVAAATRAVAEAYPAGAAKKGTMARRILDAHARQNGENLSVRFDALVSHDITYVGIVQTARASGLKAFPLPYALTNCHNSLCAVGGTINEDDHRFGLSAAVKYGGRYVPANLAVIHQYAREQLAACGGMILGSDSHTRYGALGALGIGEGGPELVKQLLGGTYDLAPPEVVLVRVSGRPQPWVGPHDVALALCAALYEDGAVKNKILEFTGEGIANLSVDFRLGVDVMTTETACLSSIWQTDELVADFYRRHGRPEAYREMKPGTAAYYDDVIELDLSQIEPMIALPYHPSRALPIRALVQNAGDVLREIERAQGMNGELTAKLDKGRLRADQGVIAGCAGGLFENLELAAQALKGRELGAFSLSAYPASVPVDLALSESGARQALIRAGALWKPCFCGPCFGAGDVPANGALSLRHTTRNFKNREGSKPGEGQGALVALMDARSIAATALNGGLLTGADEIECAFDRPRPYAFDDSAYRARVYDGVGRPRPETPLQMGPNIADWPPFDPLPEHLLLEVCSVLNDAVTTTDELIPSGETSSYRSNPQRLSEFALSRRDPGYAARSKAVRDAGADAWRDLLSPEYADETGYASMIYARCPGDGSAREQAASCQRVLGGRANLCLSYATRRYRANLVNWGILPFTCQQDPHLELGDKIFIPGVRQKLKEGAQTLLGRIISEGHAPRAIELELNGLTDAERRILLRGCLINDYAMGEERKA